MKEGYGARLGAVDVLFSICSPWKVGIERLAFLLLGLGLTEWQLFILILTIRIQI